MSWWTEEQEALRDTARRFVEREVVAHLPLWERDQEIPRELHLAAAKQGLLGISFPEEVGGQGGGLSESVALTEAMSLVRDLSTDESPQFVNGVLGNILRDKPSL